MRSQVTSARVVLAATTMMIPGTDPPRQSGLTRPPTVIDPSAEDGDAMAAFRPKPVAATGIVFAAWWPVVELGVLAVRAI